MNSGAATRWILKWRIPPDPDAAIWPLYYSGNGVSPWVWEQRDAKRFDTLAEAQRARRSWRSQAPTRWAERPRIMRLKKPEPYTFLRPDGPTFECTRCGDRYSITMPIDLELFGLFLKAYSKRHRRCRHLPPAVSPSPAVPATAAAPPNEMTPP